MCVAFLMIVLKAKERLTFEITTMFNNNNNCYQIL